MTNFLLFCCFCWFNLMAIGISPQKANGPSQPVAHQAVNGFGTVSPPKEAAPGSNVPPEDRYSALKDLDALFTTTAAASVVEPAVSASPASTSASSWTPTWAASGSVVGPPPHAPAQREPSFGNGLEQRWDGVAGFSPAQPHVNTSNPFLGKDSAVM